MKKKILKTSILLVALIMTLQLSVLAAVEKLTVGVGVAKNTVKVEDNVTVTVDWKEGMQAAVFKLKYDAEKLTFSKASIGASYYNAETEGVISVNWASLEEEDLTKMTFEFATKKEGKVEFEVTDAKFADGELEEPEEYECGKVELTIEAKAIEPETEEPKAPKEEQKEEQKEEPKEEPKDTSKANGDLPYTGGETLIAVVGCALVATIVLLRKKLSGLKGV